MQKLLEENPFPDILGQEEPKRQLASALLSNRHVIIVGPPGIGKTTLAKNVAKLNDSPFVRVQGSPDLTVEDLIGDIDPIKALEFGPTSKEAFTPGKIFQADGGVLFFDEVNRCPEKLQNSLLQVLEEGTATLGRYKLDIPAKFIFIATMNPEETAATEPLADVFLDRFDVINMGYPETPETEMRIVREKGQSITEFSDRLLIPTLAFIHALRNSKDLAKKPSVRASLGLYERAQANAKIAGRETVEAKDIADAVISVLSKRIQLKPSVKYLKTTEEFLKSQFSEFKEHTEHGGEGL